MSSEFLCLLPYPYSNHVHSLTTLIVDRSSVIARRRRSALARFARSLVARTQINTLSAHTSVPAPQLKLISNGAVLRNPSLPLAAYGLKDGSVIVLVGSKDQPTATVSTDGGAGRGASGGKRGKEVVPTTEPELKTYVEEKKSFLQGLAKDIETYEQGCQTFIAGGDGRDSAPSTTSFTHLQQSHARLSELLLQGLLRLDGIEIPPDLDGARQARKQAIKDVQRELDKVDAKWAEVKASEKKE